MKWEKVFVYEVTLKLSDESAMVFSVELPAVQPDDNPTSMDILVMDLMAALEKQHEGVREGMLYVKGYEPRIVSFEMKGEPRYKIYYADEVK